MVALRASPLRVFFGFSLRSDRRLLLARGFRLRLFYVFPNVFFRCGVDFFAPAPWALALATFALQKNRRVSLRGRSWSGCVFASLGAGPIRNIKANPCGVL